MQGVHHNQRKQPYAGGFVNLQSPDVAGFFARNDLRVPDLPYSAIRL